MKWNMSISKTEEGNITFEHLSASSQVKISKDSGSVLWLDYYELECLMKIIERVKRESSKVILEESNFDKYVSFGYLQRIGLMPDGFKASKEQYEDKIYFKEDDNGERYVPYWLYKKALESEHWKAQYEILKKQAETVAAVRKGTIISKR